MFAFILPFGPTYRFMHAVINGCFDLRANWKAKRLLFGFLTRKQRWQYRLFGQIWVQTCHGDAFRIKYARCNSVRDRRRYTSYCIVPRPYQPVPIADQMLALKLLLEDRRGYTYFEQTAISGF